MFLYPLVFLRALKKNLYVHYCFAEKQKAEKPCVTAKKIQFLRKCFSVAAARAGKPLGPGHKFTGVVSEILEQDNICTTVYAINWPTKRGILVSC